MGKERLPSTYDAPKIGCEREVALVLRNSTPRPSGINAPSGTTQWLMPASLQPQLTDWWRSELPLSSVRPVVR